MTTIHIIIDVISDGSAAYAVQMRQADVSLEFPCENAHTAEDLKDEFFASINTSGSDAKIGGVMLRRDGSPV